MDHHIYVKAQKVKYLKFKSGLYAHIDTYINKLDLYPIKRY